MENAFIASNIKDACRKYIKSEKLTKSEFCLRTGISRQTHHNIEIGKTRWVSEKTLDKLRSAGVIK